MNMSVFNEEVGSARLAVDPQAECATDLPETVVACDLEALRAHHNVLVTRRSESSKACRVGLVTLTLRVLRDAAELMGHTRGVGR
jgi:hypothetical protein